MVFSIRVSFAMGGILGLPFVEASGIAPPPSLQGGERGKLSTLAKSQSVSASGSPPFRPDLTSPDQGSLGAGIPPGMPRRPPIRGQGEPPSAPPAPRPPAARLSRRLAAGGKKLEMKGELIFGLDGVQRVQRTGNIAVLKSNPSEYFETWFRNHYKRILGARG